MSEQRSGRSGWLVSDPRYLRDVPKQRADLFRQGHGVQGTFEPERLFANEAEAQETSITLLIALKNDADGKAASYAKPSDNLKERDRENYLEEARKHLEIANAGLELLGLTAQEIENRSGIRRVR
jgi:hypothetical protein